MKQDRVYGENLLNMKRRAVSAILVVSTILCGCSLSSDLQGIKVFTVQSDLSKSQDGWEGDFTDYPATWQDSVSAELEFAYTELPSHLGEQKALKISGKNNGDQLFMFIKNKVTGLTPNTDYALVFSVDFASNATEAEQGDYGSPGKNVYLKAGASTAEPKKVIYGDACEINLDKGNAQSLSGNDMIVLGNIAVNSSA